MILFFIPNKDNISELVKVYITKHTREEKKYILLKSSVKYYPKLKESNVITINEDFSSNISALIKVCLLKNKTRVYIFLTNSQNSSLLIKIFGLLNSCQRKIINENGNYFDAYNLITWIRYFRWRIKDASSISFRDLRILLIPIALIFVTIRLILFFLNYKYSYKNKL